MANLNPAIPTVIGQPQTARKNVHAVAMPSPLTGLGEGLGNLGRGGLSLGLALSGLQQERDHADYVRALNDAEAEMNQLMRDEIFSKEGFSAQGSMERVAQFAQQVGENEALSTLQPV